MNKTTYLLDCTLRDGGLALEDAMLNTGNSSVFDDKTITAFIKTSELRSDGIKVKVYIQNKEKGNWSDTLTNQDLETKIENKILNEARILRINSLK